MGSLSAVLPNIAMILLSGLEGKTLKDIHWFKRIGNTLDISLNHWVFQLDSRNLIFYAALALPIYFLIFGLVRYFHHFLIKFVGEKVVSDIRLALMNKFIDLDILFLSRQRAGAGNVLSRCLNDIILLQHGISFYGDLIREPIIISFLISYMFLLHWKITLFFCIFMPIFVKIIGRITHSLRKYSHQSQEVLEDITQSLKEICDGTQVIQSFNLQNQMKQKFYSQAQIYLKKKKKMIQREEMGGPINEWLASILFACLSIFQAQMIWMGESDGSSFIAFLLAATMLQHPLKNFQKAAISIQQHKVALDRMYEILESPSSIQEPEKPLGFPSSWNQISFKDVSFSYKDKEVLKNLHFNIQRGELVAFVGSSGSGKTTLMGLLQRFFDPQQGEIQIGGVNIKHMNTSELRQNIAYVSQDVFLFDDTVKNNICLGDIENTSKDFLEVARRANAENFVLDMKNGFETKVGERGGRLSGGQRQRLSIARALYKDPAILILDEATSALDSESEREVQKGLDQLLKGRTTLVIAHRLSTIINSDRIVVLKEGKIVEMGTHRDLLGQSGEYSRFYKLQYNS